MAYISKYSGEDIDLRLDLINKLTPRNLLDNSDFRNPVNQRGFISTNEDSLYTIDRWVTNSAYNAATVSLDSFGMTITKNDADYGGIYQNFENYTAMYGKTYTAAICVNDIWDCVTFVMGNAAGGIMFPISGILLFSVEWAQVLLRNYSDAPITIQRAALYEGSYTAETLPEYQPKGYGAELAECKRYYRHDCLHGVSGYVLNGGQQFIGLIPDCEMRTTPTLTLTVMDNVVIEDAVVPITGVSYVSRCGDGYQVVLTLAYQMAKFGVAVIAHAQGNLSADL